MAREFGWLDIDTIAVQLAERQAGVDPLRVRFTELRRMVEALPGFAPDPDHPVNERILEEIQRLWIEELQDADRDED
ncbi:MAG: Fe-S cluster assembly protein IscX [Phycisphaerales bacterium]|nr:Fe-S cluster assembly protein IscX [Phycisphaerales bacterium]